MRHDAHGWWIADAGPPPPLAPLETDTSADVVVIGGGYTGMWAAWHVLAAAPDARVVLLEAGGCGLGPSGRNGGFVSPLGLSRPRLTEAFGAERADALVTASEASVRDIGAFCDAEAVDAWYRASSQLVVAAAPAQDGVGSAAVDERAVLAISAEEVQRRCASPVLRGGVRITTHATVHPARLAFGLRDRLLARGAAVHERSRVRALRHEGGGVVAETAGGRVRAKAAVVAVNAWSGTLAPLARRLTVSSSHIVLTEPVPDVIETLGWTGGEAISDGRALLHYTRVTRDGRILFGWAGGRMAAGARPTHRMEVDPQVIARTTRDLLRFFPALEGRRLDAAWGGPIDVSPTHIATIASLPGGRAWAAFGYTGNGVGPAHLAGRALASLALDRRDDVSRLAIVEPPPALVPPEPLRITGATVIRRALARREAIEETGGRADLPTRAVAGLPALLGMHIVR